MKIKGQELEFSYHQALAPMLWIFLFIQVVELTVVHFLLLMWVPVFAWILFTIAALGMVWITALLISFYHQPVLLHDKGLQIRCGFTLNLSIAYDNISSTDVAFDKGTATAKSTCNPVDLFMVEPNVTLALVRPVPYQNVIGRNRSYDKVAIRLDEPQRFLSELRKRLPN